MSPSGFLGFLKPFESFRSELFGVVKTEVLSMLGLLNSRSLPLFNWTPKVLEI